MKYATTAAGLRYASTLVQIAPVGFSHDLAGNKPCDLCVAQCSHVWVPSRLTFPPPPVNDKQC